MTPPSTSTGPLPAFAEPLGNPGSTLAAASAALLAELESSLGASQRALLARDISTLEQATREQTRLRWALEILLARGVTSSPVSNAEPNPDGMGEALCEAAFAAELLAAQRRVLHLGKVQAALLTREQRWLTVLANLVAGPEANYGSAGDRRDASAIDAHAK